MANGLHIEEPGIYLTVTDAAAELGIAVGALRTRLLKGQMRGLRAGSFWLLPLAEVERAKAAGRIRAGRPPRQKLPDRPESAR